jgi:cytochrome c biogenesis protein CcmG, thiol:disulfide interchange protein DsbE
MLLTVLAVAVLLPGRVAPPLGYRDAAGQAQRVQRGTPLIVSFWASWCGPCREELPRLKRAAAGGRVRVLALNYGESVGTAQAYLKREGLSGLPAGYVRAADPQLWPIPGLPSSVLLNAAGVVQRVQYGPLNEATLNSWLAQGLK